MVMNETDPEHIEDFDEHVEDDDDHVEIVVVAGRAAGLVSLLADWLIFLYTS